MKSNAVAVFMLLMTVTGFAGMTFDDIDVWVGSGQNEAALVVDWNNGESELVKVWGFRWDGTATGVDMLMAVLAADSSFYAMSSASTPLSIGGFGYDIDSDGFDIVNADSTPSNFNAEGLMAVAGYAYDDWSVTDVDDIWSSGWNTGYWAYYGIDTAITWIYPGAGASDRVLQDGSWDGWSWAAAPTWDGGVPSVDVVPEPATMALLGIGMLFVRKRK